MSIHWYSSFYKHTNEWAELFNRMSAQVIVHSHLANCMLQVLYDITCETPCQIVKCLTYHSDMMEDV